MCQYQHLKKTKWSKIENMSVSHMVNAFCISISIYIYFPGNSAGKESACSSGDLVRFLSWEDPLGSSQEEGIGHPLQYTWASLVAQMPKNLPAVWETWV